MPPTARLYVTVGSLSSLSTDHLVAELRRRIPDPAVVKVAGEVLAAIRPLAARPAVLEEVSTEELTAELNLRHPLGEPDAGRAESMATGEAAMPAEPDPGPGGELGAAYRDGYNAGAEVATLERDRARDLAARLEEELARTAGELTQARRHNTEHARQLAGTQRLLAAESNRRAVIAGELDQARTAQAAARGALEEYRTATLELAELLVEKHRMTAGQVARRLELPEHEWLERVMGSARRMILEHAEELERGAEGYGLLLERVAELTAEVATLERARDLAARVVSIARELGIVHPSEQTEPEELAARLDAALERGTVAGGALAGIAQAVSEHLGLSTGEGDEGTALVVCTLISELATRRAAS